MAGTFYDIQATNAKGQVRQLSDYKGEVLLIVNVASKCGFTPQYAGLEKLYQDYKDRGFRILAFPSNDFGGQEPGAIEEIGEYCKANYGVTFDLFDKVHARGDEMHELYRYLTTNAEPSGDVQWNFEKFVIGKDGAIAGRFSSKIVPEDEALRSAIERELLR